MNKNTKQQHVKIDKSMSTGNLPDMDIATSIINSTSDAIIAGNLNGEISLWNKGAEALYGYTAEEALGKNISMIYREADIPVLIERIQQVMQGKNISNVEVTVIDKLKNEHTVLLSLNGLVDEQGNINQLVGLTKDITTQKKSHQELEKAKEEAERSEDSLNNILNHIGDPVFVKDKDSYLVLVNDAFCKLFNLDRIDIIGKTLAEDVTPDEMKAFLKIDKEVLKTGKESLVEESLTLRGEQKKIILTKKTRYIDSNDEKFIIGVIRDISERIKTEKRLEESKSKFEILTNVTFEGILIHDKGFPIDMNMSFPKMFGYKKEDLFKADLIRIIVHKDYQQLVSDNIKNAVETPYEIIGIKKDGTEFPIEIEGRTYISEENNKYRVTSIRDISQRKEAEIELKKAQKIARVGSWYIDILTGEMVWSNELYKMYNFDPKLPLPPLSEHKKYLTPESWELLSSCIDNTIKTGKPYSIELKGAEGLGNNWKWLYGRGEAVFNSDNKIIGVRGTAQDITVQKETEEELKTAIAEISDLKQKLEAENIYLKEELKLENNFEDIVGSSKSITAVLKQVEQVAKSDTTVLLLGETGTGKELFAKAVHRASKRNDKPLIKVNCSALPSELIESELFGHEKGAFTGAINRKIGRFELAHNGTIFLDEIGDLPINLQTRLLRVLQEHEFERLGGESTIKVDVRVISATNRNLEELVTQGKFREDLFYRLNVFPITSPPLRNRKEDIPFLVNHFINKYKKNINRDIQSVHKTTLEKLMRYNWPGNIRELEHVIERAIVLNQGKQLRIGNWFGYSKFETLGELISLEKLERDHIIKVLESTNGKIRGKNGAAEIVGLKPTTLESRMKKLNISKK